MRFQRHTQGLLSHKTHTYALDPILLNAPLLLFLLRFLYANSVTHIASVQKGSIEIPCVWAFDWHHYMMLGLDSWGQIDPQSVVFADGFVLQVSLVPNITMTNKRCCGNAECCQA